MTKGELLDDMEDGLPDSADQIAAFVLVRTERGSMEVLAFCDEGFDVEVVASHVGLRIMPGKVMFNG